MSGCEGAVVDRWVDIGTGYALAGDVSELAIYFIFPVLHLITVTNSSYLH